MKEGWALTTLGNSCEVVNGGTPKTGVTDYWGGGHLWITPAEMGRRTSPYVDETARTLTNLGLQDSSARLLPPLSVILSSRAPIGHLVINTKAMATNQGCKGLVPNKHLDHKFLFYYLGSIVGLLNDLGTGTTFKEISGGRLKEVPLPLPPLPEQKRIVAILDETFEGIGTAVANAEKNLANARELFDSYLTTVFSRHDAGWMRRPLSTLCEKITVGHVGSMSSRYKSSGIPFLRSQNIRPFELAMESVVFIDEQFHLELKKSRLRPGDIAVVRTGYPGTAAVIPPELEDANCSDLVIIRPGAEVNPHYLAAFFNSACGKKLVLGKLVGAAQKHFNIGAAREVLLHYPSVQRQEQIVSELSGFRTETERLQSLCQRKIAALGQLQQAILQRAFAGELTALPAEAVQEAAE